MRLTRSRLRTTSALIAVALGASMIGGGSAQAVSGVTPVPDGTHLFTAKIQNDLRGCTAALVAPTWVITTASCLAEPGRPLAAGAPSRPTTVTVGRTDLTATGGHVLAVTSVLPHPTRNVALAQLERPASGVTPVALGGQALPGEQLVAAGFGRTATEWLPNRLHAGTFAVTGVTADAVAVDGSGTGASLCRGDAGGPLLRTGLGAPQLVALHDRSWQGGCLGETDTRRTATEVRVDDLGTWLAQSTVNRYTALSPGGTLLDTRNDTGATSGPRATGSTTDFQVLGQAGVPATGVTAVLVDVTAIAPTAYTFLTVFPEGTQRPDSSSLNASPGETISTTQVVPVGPGGKLSVYNHAGDTHVMVDVHGYFSATGGGLVAVPHTRVVDTRNGSGTTVGTVPDNGTRTFTLTGGVVPAGATNALIDVAVVGATGPGFLRAYPTGGAVDNVSVMDYVGGVTSQGMSVTLSSTGKVTFVNRGPAVHLVISVQGYVAATGGDLRTVPATKVVDTRDNGGLPLKAKGELFLDVKANGVPVKGAALLSVTTVDPKASGYLTVESADGPFAYTDNGPTLTSQSVANFTAGHRARTTMVVTRVSQDDDRSGGPAGKIRIVNASGDTVHVVVTLVGWFNQPTTTGS